LAGQAIELILPERKRHAGGAGGHTLLGRARFWRHEATEQAFPIGNRLCPRQDRYRRPVSFDFFGAVEIEVKAVPIKIGVVPRVPKKFGNKWRLIEAKLFRGQPFCLSKSAAKGTNQVSSQQPLFRTQHPDTCWIANQASSFRPDPPQVFD
jgi:hypothetical protein